MSSRPAIEGWFTIPVVESGPPVESGPTVNSGAPALIGTRCSQSGTYYFPPERVMSRAPGCADAELEEVTLSRRGRLWSYTDANYQPPEPYVPVTDPHVPFCIAAVELELEKMVVMGQVVAGVTVDDLEVGMEMELVIDTLFDDDEGTQLVWKWRPAGERTDDDGLAG